MFDSPEYKKIVKKQKKLLEQTEALEQERRDLIGSTKYACVVCGKDHRVDETINVRFQQFHHSYNSYEDPYETEYEHKSYMIAPCGVSLIWEDRKKYEGFFKANVNEHQDKSWAACLFDAWLDDGRKKWHNREDMVKYFLPK